MANRFEAASLWLAWTTGLPKRSAWRRLAFQRSLRENALDFAGVTLDSAELVMNESLRRLGEAGGFSAVLLKLTGFKLVDEFRWSRNRADRASGKLATGKLEAPWLEQRLAEEGAMVIIDVARLPAGSAAEMSALAESGAGSMVVNRLSMGDRKLGTLYLLSGQARLDLAPFDQRLLRACGELYSRVLFRLQNEERARLSKPIG
jgi:hypothetical protein